MDARPLHLADDAVSALLAACAATDGRESLSEHKSLALNSPVRPGAGVVLSREGRPVALVYGVPGPRRGVREVETAVHPDHRDPETLREVAVAAASLFPEETEHIWAFLPGMIAALAALGFAEHRRLLRLTRPLPPDTRPAPPAGIEIRPFRPGEDEDRWLAAQAAAFAAHPEAGMWTAAWLEDRMSRPWFDPRGFLVAWAGSEIAGYCWTKVHPGAVGEIFMIGVHPDHRGRGLGKTMSLAGLWDLYRRRGCETATLYTDGDNRSGLRMYRNLGFVTAWEDVSFVVRP